MKSTTRKHIWPVSLVMTLAVVGMLAAFVALAVAPQATEAQQPPPPPPPPSGQPTPEPTGDGPAGVPPPPPPPSAAMDSFESDSTSGGAGVKLTLTIGNPGMLVSGSSIELYLEDDFQVPDDIDESDVYFVGRTVGRVYATDPIEIDDDDHFGGDDDWSILVQVPDMNPANDTGFDAWSAEDAAGLEVVFTKGAGIKNPTEQGTHSVGYSVLAPGDDTNDGPMVELDAVATVAKISLSADDGGRGKELTVTGSGFNNGTGAAVYVYVSADTKPSCEDVIRKGKKLGEAEVGSDDKFAITFEVDEDKFDPGSGPDEDNPGVNWLCAVDSEAGNPRMASAVKAFELTPTVSVDPESGSYGDEITLKARDFGGKLTQISLGPNNVWRADGTCPEDKTCNFDVDEDDNDYTFELPGGLDSRIQVAAIGPEPDKTRKTATLTVEPSSLDLSLDAAVANDSIIIEGRGFDSQAHILIKDITLDGEPLAVERAGTDSCDGDRCIQIDSNGQFVVEARVWVTSDADNNPALDADTYTVKVVDSTGFEGEADLEIKEPSISIDPMVAGPRDYITISGMNWPLSTEDHDFQVTIMVDGRSRTESIDGAGRFSHQVRLSSDIDLGEEHEVTVIFGDKDIEEDATFMTPSSGISVNPSQARPGETISVELLGMPVYTLVEEVKIAGANRLGNQNVNTDRDGNATVSGILVPAVDPGFYSVQVRVGPRDGGETAVAQLEILSDATAPGTATMLPDAVSDLGDNLDAIFHFNNATKAWTFFDPRPEFADLNTLNELISGQPYWVLVKAEQTGVDWNGRSVDLTCAAGDCWNLEIW